MTSTGVLGRPRRKVFGARRARSALMHRKIVSSSSRRSSSRSTGSKRQSRVGTRSNRATGGYRSTNMMAVLPRAKTQGPPSQFAQVLIFAPETSANPEIEPDLLRYGPVLDAPAHHSG